MVKPLEIKKDEKEADGKEEAKDKKPEPKTDVFKIRQRHAKIEPALAQQFANNRLLGK